MFSACILYRTGSVYVLYMISEEGQHQVAGKEETTQGFLDERSACDFMRQQSAWNGAIEKKEALPGEIKMCQNIY